MNIKGWKKFQHFKDRRPPWIKLYRDLLDDPEWHDLDAGAAKTLVMLWLIASENDGALPDTRKLAFRLRSSEDQVKQLLISLSHWLEGDDIATISSRYHDDAPETETETETESANAVVNLNFEYEGRHFRLTKKDFDQWKLSFSFIDIRAEMTALDSWVGTLEKSRRYHAMSNALNKRNREAKIAIEKEKKQPYKWNGIEGVI